MFLTVVYVLQSYTSYLEQRVISSWYRNKCLFFCLNAPHPWATGGHNSGQSEFACIGSNNML